MHRTFDSEEEKVFGKTQSREVGQKISQSIQD